jgi:hypothetical protein
MTEMQVSFDTATDVSKRTKIYSGLLLKAVIAELVKVQTLIRLILLLINKLQKVQRSVITEPEVFLATTPQIKCG